jgi:ABC-type sugar transport system ATPase subunit
VGNALVDISAISKHFPGVQALDGVSFDILRGEVHGVIGENGAGKSTLMRILAGAESPDEGRILLDGRPVRFHNPLDARQAGVAIVYQELTIFPNLSVAENVFANRQPSRSGFLRKRELAARTRRLLEMFGLELDPATPVRLLGIADRQIIEILRAISLEPKLLILDEPTSSLTQAEVKRLFELLERLTREGIAVLYVSHQLQEILRLSDRITVLRDGKYIGTVTRESATETGLVEMMVGRAVELYKGYDAARKIGGPVLEVHDLACGERFHDVTFQIHAGEILGFAGLVGAGRSELARTIFGLEPPTGGTITVNGALHTAATPRQAIAHGIAYVPEDRKTLGLFLPMMIRDNMVAPQLDRVAPLGWISDRRVQDITVEYIQRVGIVARGPRQWAVTLSGGNQQKLMLSMWLALQPKVLIVDEPTRGIDVGAKVEIHGLLRKLANDGMAVMLISSELPEILTMSDRVAVMRVGELAAVLPRAQASQELIIAIASGAERGEL